MRVADPTARRMHHPMMIAGIILGGRRPVPGELRDVPVGESIPVVP
jgi:hypothetical protein